MITDIIITRSGYTLQEAAVRLNKTVAQILQMLKNRQIGGVYEKGTWQLSRTSVDNLAPNGIDDKWRVPQASQAIPISRAQKPVFGIPKASVAAPTDMRPWSLPPCVSRVQTSAGVSPAAMATYSKATVAASTPQWLTIYEAADRIGCSSGQVSALVASRVLSAGQTLAGLLVSLASVLQYIKSGKQPPVTTGDKYTTLGGV